MLEGGKVLCDLFLLLDDGGGAVAEVCHKWGALLCKLDKVNEGREDEAHAFWVREMEVLCTKVQDLCGVCEAGKGVEEKVVCDAGGIEVLGGMRTHSTWGSRNTMFGSSSAARAF